MQELYNILLVEDDDKIREIITYYFNNKRDKRFKVIEAKDGKECFSCLFENKIDLVLLDIMLPEVNGFEICKEIRRKDDIPIIFITAKAREEDILQGYKNGCDDYVIKPFRMAELYAKVNALINRTKGMVISSRIVVGKIEIDPYKKQVSCEGEQIRLPNIEYELLRLLMENRYCSVSREKIITDVWGYDYEGNERVIDDHIRKLRKSLGNCGKQIKTDVNYGYRISDE